ncbi:hypothetical protein [Sphingomonas sp. NPDC079357]|uniref:hypothetical protein n=1 Tax=Sphingomonas sp. NPDC079357 TaxID=3364518 RepID=UPI00384AE984
MAKVLAGNPHVASVIRWGLVLHRSDAQPAQNDNCTPTEGLDQFFTMQRVADYLYGVLQKHIDLGRYMMVEPSAGMGAFFRLMPPGSLAYDLDPRYPGVRTADFLQAELPRDRKILIMGNPPFGRSARLALEFFNHAAWQAKVIAMILPKTFRKSSIMRDLNPAFHLIHDE